MSVVAYRDGVMASDSRAYGGKGNPSPGHKSKIHRLPRGALLGITSGVLGESERFLEWALSGAGPEEWKGDKPDVFAMGVNTIGELVLFDGSPHPSGPIKADYFAIGSGAKYALGALAAGKSAAEAVAIAIELDPHCGGEVMTLELRS